MWSVEDVSMSNENIQGFVDKILIISHQVFHNIHLVVPNMNISLLAFGFDQMNYWINANAPKADRCCFDVLGHHRFPSVTLILIRNNFFSF